MKEEILRLRAEGKSYKKIKKILGCSLGTIAYHCGEGQKKKAIDRMMKRRKETVLSQKVERFRRDKKLRDKAEDFQRERLEWKRTSRLGKRSLTFSWRDVIDKFGWETTCYLTGRAINLRDPKSYQFDHKIPYSRGGSCELDNLGITCKAANVAKSDMTIEEFIETCKEVLEFNGYEVRKGTEVV